MTEIHNIFKGKLLKIDSRANDKNEMNIRLIFKSQKLDRGLEEMVACSQPVKLDVEHHHLLEFYKSYVGKEIYVPVALTGMDGNIFYRTSGDGRVLQLEEKKAPELKTSFDSKA